MFLFFWLYFIFFQAKLREVCTLLSHKVQSEVEAQAAKLLQTIQIMRVLFREQTQRSLLNNACASSPWQTVTGATDLDT